MRGHVGALGAPELRLCRASTAPSGADKTRGVRRIGIIMEDARRERDLAALPCLTYGNAVSRRRSRGLRSLERSASGDHADQYDNNSDDKENVNQPAADVQRKSAEPHNDEDDDDQPQ